MQTPSDCRATACVSDPQMSQLTAPLVYEQVPVQYGSHTDHTHTHTDEEIHLFSRVTYTKAILILPADTTELDSRVES